MSVSFYCGCGFTYRGDDADPAVLDHRPPADSCCNCGGRKCMDCVLRYQHDRCEDSCPDCGAAS